MTKSYSFKKRIQIYQKTNGHCSYCGNPLSLDNWAMEHMNPKLKNGTDKIENLTPSCHSCNSKKNRKTVDEFRDYLTQKPIDEIRKTIEHIRMYGITKNQSKTIEALEYAIKLLEDNKFKFFFDSPEANYDNDSRYSWNINPCQ